MIDNRYINRQMVDGQINGRQMIDIYTHIYIDTYFKELMSKLKCFYDQKQNITAN